VDSQGNVISETMVEMHCATDKLNLLLVFLRWQDFLLTQTGNLGHTDNSPCSQRKILKHPSSFEFCTMGNYNIAKDTN
jgi:hypothetical protein